MSLTNTLKTAYKKGKDIAMNAPEIERKVKDATSNDKWGPTGTQMQEISRSTYNFHDFPVIMGVIWKRINDPGKYWRHVYKSLLLIDYLVRNGSEQVIRDCRMHVIEIQTLTEFQYIEEEKDVGLSVRERAKQVIELLHDDKRIKIEREKAKANRDKYVGVGNGAPGGGRYGGDSYSGGGYGDGGYGDSGDYGGDRDSYGGNRDSYGGNRDSYGGNRESYGGNRERGDSYGGGNRDRDSYGGGGDRDSYGGRGGSDYGYGGDNGYRGDDDEGRYEEPNRYEDNNQYDRPSSGREYEQPQKPTRTNSSSNPSSNTSSNSAQSSNRRPRAPSGGQEQLQAPNSQLFAIDDVMNAPQPQMRQSASDSLFEAFGENTGQFGGSQGAHGAFFPPASGGGGGGGGSLFDSNPPSSQGFDAFNPRGQDQGDFGEFQSSQNEGFNPFDQQQQGGGNDPFGVQQQQQQPEKKEADPWAKKELFNLDSLNVTEKPGQPRTSTGPSPSKTPMAAMSKTPMVVSKGPTISSGTTINSTPMGRGMGGPNYNLGTGMPGGYPNPGGYPPMQPGGYPNPGGYPPQPGFPPGAGMFPQPPFYGGAPPGTMGGPMGGTMGAPMGGTMGAPMGGTMGGPMGSGGFTMNMTNNNAPKRY